jgi:hypothetical protein
MDFEIIHIIAIALDIDGLQSSLNATHQARTLVTAEIEAARALEVLEQRFERRRGRRFLLLLTPAAAAVPVFKVVDAFDAVPAVVVTFAFVQACCS